MGKRIWQYPEATGITNDDVILLDSPTGGSRSIKANKIGSVLINKTFTERGTFDAAEDNADGYKKVTVDVPYTDVLVASGPIASWDDGEDLPLKSLTVNITPQQDLSHGNPSPSNICPISGWDECNVTVSPLNINPLYNGQIYGDGTWVENSARLTNAQTAQSNVYFLKAGTYTLDFDKLNPNAPNLVECALLTKDSNFNIVEKSANAWQSLPFTFTLTQAGYLYFTMRKDYSTLLNPSDYKAKILGQTYTIDLDGTRYGGTLDVVSGELVVDRIKWVITPTASQISNVGTSDCIIQLTNAQVPNSYNVTVNKGISNKLKVTNYSAQHDDHIHFPNTSMIALYLSNEVGTTKQAWVDYLAQEQIEISYLVATPLTYQLTPQQIKSLVGKNNIYSDTGDVDVEYQKIWVRPSA